MKKITLTIITEDQNSKTKAEKLSKIINDNNKNFKLTSIKKYHKFENSFQFEYELLIDSEKKLINEILDCSNKIAMPWLMYYNAENQAIELLFNKDDSSKFAKVEFNVIKWMQIQCE